MFEKRLSFVLVQARRQPLGFGPQFEFSLLRFSFLAMIFIDLVVESARGMPGCKLTVIPGP